MGTFASKSSIMLALLGCTVLAAAAAGQAKDPDAASEGRAEPAQCVTFDTQVRYRNFGYDHLVVLHNTCKNPVSCSVTTDVNPSPISVDLKPDEEISVMTFTASPSRIFHADVSCQEHE